MAGVNGSGRFRWPQNERMAVVVTCLLENWSGDRGPPFSVQTTALKPGTHDRAAMTWGTYGGRAGVWRLLKILNDSRCPSTFVANAHSLELAPAAARQIVESGHEIAAHSYTQDALMAYMSPEEERATIRRCIGVFKDVVGRRPDGWLSPVLAPTAHTEGLVAEEGFLWYGDYNNIDLPFCRETPGGTVVALPHTDFADHRVLRLSTRDWFDVYKDTFDYLHATEPSAFLNITVHCHFGGRPLMAAQLHKILRYIRGFPDVWIARHDDVARWVKAEGFAEWTNQQRFFPAAGQE